MGKGNSKVPEKLATIIYRKLSLNNAFIKSLLFVWLINSFILILMIMIHFKRSSASLVATYVVGTGLLTLLNVYIASCLVNGNCKTLAYLSLMTGFVFLSTTALLIN